MAQAQAAQHLAMNNCNAVCVALDGSRLGSPAQETEALCFWNPDTNSGGWLPPQAVFFQSAAMGGSSLAHGRLILGGGHQLQESLGAQTHLPYLSERLA